METPEAILLRARNELYAKDHRRAKAVRARLLGLDPAVAPTEAQINASPRFALRSAAAERDAPDIITDYWMPYLEENCRLADCPPEEFHATGTGCRCTPLKSWRSIYQQPCQPLGRPSLPPDGGRTPKRSPRHGQGVHANELSPKGVPEKGIPYDWGKAEAGRLLPVLWRYQR